MISLANDRYERFVPAIFIKEARQSLSQNAFVIQFSALHALLAFTAFSGVSAASSGVFTGSPFEREGVFWFILSAFLLVVAPISSVNTLSNEISGNTIELMRMTRLSSRKIVYGKWFYQLMHIVTVSLSAAPYLLIMQLARGADLVHGFWMISLISLVSCLVTGIGIGLSAFGTGRLRPIFFIGVLIFLYFGGISLYSSTMITGVSLFSSDMIVTTLALGVPVTLFALEIGSAKIGSEIENGSFCIRMLGLALVIAPSILIYLEILPAFAMVFGIAMAILLPWHPMLSQPILNPGVLRVYRQSGKLGQSFGKLIFLPGWHTGTTFVFIFLVIFSIFVIGLSKEVSDSERFEMLYVFANMAMIPGFLRLVREVFQKEGMPFPARPFFFTVVSIVVFSLGIGLIKLYMGINLMPYTAVTPISSFLYMFFDSFRDNFDFQLVVSFLGILGTTIGLWIKSKPVWERVWKLEDLLQAQSRAIPDTESQLGKSE